MSVGLRECLQGFLSDRSHSNTSDCWEEKLFFYPVKFSMWGPANLLPIHGVTRKKTKFIPMVERGLQA
jgi:hypothetical protein